MQVRLLTDTDNDKANNAVGNLENTLNFLREITIGSKISLYVLTVLLTFNLISEFLDTESIKRIQSSSGFNLCLDCVSKRSCTLIT